MLGSNTQKVLCAENGHLIEDGCLAADSHFIETRRNESGLHN